MKFSHSGIEYQITLNNEFIDYPFSILIGEIWYYADLANLKYGSSVYASKALNKKFYYYGKRLLKLKAFQ